MVGVGEVIRHASGLYFDWLARIVAFHFVMDWIWLWFDGLGGNRAVVQNVMGRFVIRRRVVKFFEYCVPKVCYVPHNVQFIFVFGEGMLGKVSQLLVHSRLLGYVKDNSIPRKHTRADTT